MLEENYVDEGWLYADQKYLDEWPGHGAVPMPPWAFPGPWTSKEYQVTDDIDGPVMKSPMEGPRDAGHRLVAWHFSSLRISPDGTVIQYANAEYALSEETIESVYLPYVAELRKAMGL